MPKPGTDGAPGRVDPRDKQQEALRRALQLMSEAVDQADTASSGDQVLLGRTFGSLAEELSHGDKQEVQEAKQ